MNKLINEILPEIIQIRKNLHQYPELSQFEFDTQKKIIEYIEKYTSAEIRKVSKTGVIAIFDSTKNGKTTLLRADTDALPIQEINEFEYNLPRLGYLINVGMMDILVFFLV